MMNLKQTIRRVLREHTGLPLRIRRRLDMDNLEELFQKNLDLAEKKYKDSKPFWNSFNFNKFRQMVVSYLIEDLGIIFFSDTNNFSYEFDELYNFLMEHFSDRILDRYNTI